MTVATREEVVQEARTWLGTPYQKMARVKGAGCDCGTLLLGIYQNMGLIADEDLETYGHDWWLHVKEEFYLRHVVRHALQIAERVFYRTDTIAPGNLALCRVRSFKYNHGAIVTQWPLGVHAVYAGVKEVNLTTDPMWAYKEIALFDPWAKREAEKCLVR
jgi:cell wall-associated NlpC family hydrolase